MRFTTNLCIAYTIILSMGIIFLISTVLGLGMHREPYFSFFYLLAWWPYIIGAEAWLWTKGKSVLFNQPRRYLVLVPMSTLFWLIFEIFNFRLENWHYLYSKENVFLRWPAYFFAFGTVLPGLLVTQRIIAHIRLRVGIFKSREWDARPYLILIFWLGLITVALPILYPRFGFALIWVAVLLILEPILYACGQPCFLRDIKNGDYTDIAHWLLAGLVCGFLWEFWNFWAGSKWYYTVPFVGSGKIFEMPVLGFIGFPPFSLECAAMIRFYDMIQARMQHHLSLQRRSKLQFYLFLTGVGFSLFGFVGIDWITVEAP